MLSRLKMWVCSGEILTADLLLDFYNYFPTGTIICNYYGSTEVMGDVTYALFESRQGVVDALVENKVPIGISTCKKKTLRIIFLLLFTHSHFITRYRKTSGQLFHLFIGFQYATTCS